jgi:hypothetical protein
MRKDKIINMLYEWQTGNPKCKSWETSLRAEMYKIGLRYIWLDRQGRDMRAIYQTIKLHAMIFKGRQVYRK